MQPSSIEPQLEPQAPLSRTSWLVTGLAILVLIICFALYASRSKDYATPKPKDSHSSAITNPGVLTYWMSAGAYKYTLDRINDYLSQNNAQGSRLTVVNNKVSPELYGGFSFSLLVEPGGKTHKIVETTKVIAGVLNYSTTIDGNPQELAPLSSSNGTSFSGIDSLINSGLSAAQASELQKALLQFSPSASSIAVSSNSLKISGPVSSGQSVATFTVAVDKTNYSAKIEYSGLNTLELFLSSGGKQLFDSGILNSSD